MMYKIPIKEFEALRLKAGNICTANEGQPCEELHGAIVTLKDGSQVIVAHAVDKDGKNIIDDTEITKVKGEAIADYELWKKNNVALGE
jgi:hypothetical protein